MPIRIQVLSKQFTALMCSVLLVPGGPPSVAQAHEQQEAAAAQEQAPPRRSTSAFGEDTFGRGAERVARFFGTPYYIVGQTAGKSCSAIWGRRRSHIRAYASRLFSDTPAAAAIAATELAESGFTAIKFGWGSFGCDRQHDCAV